MVKRTKKTKTGMRAPARFGPVSSITTAPVSIGNSIRGSKPRVRQTTDGARVVGRDFAFALSGTGSAITGWELIGGMPITPCVLPSSVLRNYCQMFQKFRVNRIVAHYITSSATSQTGDVLFYYERDRNAPFPDYTNSNFLPYVLSDEHTIIGPQWMNHSALIKPTPEWRSTLYGNQTDINEDSNGTLFFFSKTSTVSSPGYMLIDYDVSFKELAVNPRAGTLPVARGQSSFVCFTLNFVSVVGSAFYSADVNSGKTISNTVSAPVQGLANGDIYKCIFQITASTLINGAWTGATVSNLLRYTDNTAVTLDDGFTCYVVNDNGTYYFYATLESAVVRSGNLEFNVAAALVVNICAELQLVRNVDALTQFAY